ncbi:MAG: polysaccharide export protein [Elusimicrobia bacterium]|nr:polysaccharide export protein [Elusimicrobiota bacterium]
MKIRLELFLIGALVLISGCGARRGLRESDSVASSSKPSRAQSAAEEAALMSALQDVQNKKADYKISGADLLDITIYQQQDLDRKVRVSQNGTISFPLIGIVEVGGLSVNQAEEAISKKLRDYLISPQVSIFIKEYGNKKVFVLGEVKKPGSVELPTEAKLTVVEAISLAGGFTPIAAPDRTKIIRTMDGKSQILTVEISAITKRGEKQKDLFLEPSDVVYIPQSFF